MPSFRSPLPESARKLASLLKGPLGTSFGLLAEHALRTRYPPRENSPPEQQRRHRARSLISKAIEPLEERGMIIRRKVDLCAEIPAIVAVFDSKESRVLPSDLYRRLVIHWRGHAGRVPVELIALSEHEREIERVNDRYRSESMSSELILGRRFLSLSKSETGSWTRHPRSLEAADKDDRRYFAIASYKSAEGEAVMVCTPMVGNWLMGRDKQKADAESVTGLLQNLLRECHATKHRLQLWLPERVVAEEATGWPE